MMHLETFDEKLDLSYLFEKQMELTKIVRKAKGIKNPQERKDKGAIICELWEMANELKSDGFKYWTEKKRTGHVLDEVVDILHFYLQTGNDMGVVVEHYHVEYRDDLLEQILALNTSMIMMDGPLMWNMSFAQFRGIIHSLGYDWEMDILQTYELKYQENIRRQENGY